MIMLALLYACVGGVCNGTYAVFVKVPSSMGVDPHPIVWTVYQAFWLLVLGSVLVLRRVVAGQEPVYAPTWWGILSACAWVPAALAVNASVQMVGVGMASTMEAASLACLSFLLGVFFLGENMRVFDVGGHSVCLAPVFFFLVLVGIVCLALAPFAPEPRRQAAPLLPSIGEVQSCEAPEGARGSRATRPESRPSLMTVPRSSWPGIGEPASFLERSVTSCDARPQARASWPAVAGSASARTGCLHIILGVAVAALGGFFATIVMGAVTIGRKIEMEHYNCESSIDDCPLHVAERFDDWGSWMLTNGIGAVCVACFFWALFAARALSARESLEPLQLHVRQIGLQASAAGILMSCAKLMGNAACLAGGNAVSVCVMKSVTMVIAGCWAILYYKEFGGRRAGLWSMAAVWTVSCMAILSMQKV